MPSPPVFAQAGAKHVELSAQYAWARADQFDSGDPGFGGRVGWRLDPVALEAEFNLYPRELPAPRGFSRARLEALFGATAGPRLGRVRPFARLRPGLLRFRPASEPLACILIFPPPLNCELARGRTLFAADIGGGLDVLAAGGAFVRVDAGDRLVRYPGPVFDNQRVVHDTAFFEHELRLAAGVGIRF